MKPFFVRPYTSASPRSIFPFLLPFILAFAVFSASSIGILHAQTPEPISVESNPLEGTYSESQAQGIDRMIMCPVCPAETIDQAQVEISMQMRKIVREMLSQGNSRDEILDFFVERYGNDILAAPPKSGANLVAWLMPVVAVVGGLVAVYFILRSMTRRGPAAAIAQPVTDAGLIPYLQLVDRHLAMRRAAPQPSDTSNQPDSSVQSSSTGHSSSTGQSSSTDTPDEAEEGR